MRNMRKNLKYRIIFLYVLTAGLILLSACQKPGRRNTESTASVEGAGAMETDLAYYYVAESEYGYYSWKDISLDSGFPMLMFTDKQSGATVPLCSRPDCTHDSAECNACFPEMGADTNTGVDAYYVQYYEDSVYIIGLGEDDYVTLYRVEADGSEWEESTRLYRTDYSATGHWRTPEILIADGYVYFIDYKQKSMTLSRMPIGGTEAEVIYEDDSDAEVQIHRLKYRDGFMYFQVVTFPEGKYELHEAALYRYDTENGQYSLVKPGIYGSYSVQNDLVYYVDENGIFCHSMQEQTEKTVAEQPLDYPTVTLTEDYIILCDLKGDGTLAFYDYEGKETAIVSCNLDALILYMGGNSNMLFSKAVDDGELKWCFLDLKKPLADMQWEDLQKD